MATVTNRKYEKSEILALEELRLVPKPQLTYSNFINFTNISITDAAVKRLAEKFSFPSIITSLVTVETSKGMKQSVKQIFKPVFPDDILLNIFSFLPDLDSAILVNKDWSKVAYACQTRRMLSWFAGLGYAYDV